MYWNECQNLMSRLLLLEVSLFRSYFVSALQYLDCYHKEYPVKQKASYTWSWLWNLAFFCWIFVIFSYFSYLKLTYFWISCPSSTMEGSEGVIFNKAPDWKSLFLFKIMIKQNLGCPNKEYNAIFKHIHQNIRVYPRSKKMHCWLIGKTLHIGKSLCWVGYRWITMVFWKYSWLVLWGLRNPREILQFLLPIKVVKSISGT